MDTISSPEDLYKYLRESKTKLLANIMFAGSPGHQVAELDYFLRKYRCGDVPRETRYLWIQRAGAITSTLAEVYANQFRQYGLGMLAHDHYYAMASQITRMVPELGVDVGLSHLKNAVLSRDQTYVSRFGDDLYYNVTNDAVLRATMDYHRTRSLTEDFNPWAAGLPPIDGPLAELLGGRIEKVAAIHFRKNPGNAGVKIPPENFFPTLEYLRDNGYNLVKVGTEPYPEEFAPYEVINYTDSPLRSFRNDLALLGNAKLNVINASGLEHIADVLGCRSSPTGAGTSPSARIRARWSSCRRCSSTRSVSGFLPLPSRCCSSRRAKNGGKASFSAGISRSTVSPPGRRSPTNSSLRRRRPLPSAMPASP
jgi:hypothetical protein